MGQGFTIKCEKCGTENSYLQGIGFMYYSFLERTKEDVIKGKFGKDAKAFLQKIRTVSLMPEMKCIYVRNVSISSRVWI